MKTEPQTLKRFLEYAQRDAISLVLLVLVALACSSIAYRIGISKGKTLSLEKEAPVEPETSNAPTTWTCSMHPTIQLPKPGQCPLCGMDLIPLEKGNADGRPRTLVMSPAAMALAEIRTRPVERRFVTHTIQMVGKVHYDETKLAYITANFPGRLDRLFVDYTGVTVKKNDHLVEIYSPELLTAQQELLEAIKGVPKGEDTPAELREMAQSLVKSAEEKLRLWGLNSDQIESIKTSQTLKDNLTINAPVGGIVIHKTALEGMWVKTGSKIYTIADLSRVWVFLDAYESDLPWVHYGQNVEFATEAYPDKIFKGRIAFVSPVLDEKTRTVRLRVNVENPNGMLKPEMFIRASIHARVANKGHVIDSSLAGKWISPMHPEIIRDKPGPCPECGMDLVPAETLGVKSGEGEPPLIVPASAVLVTGRRAVVYVKDQKARQPTFIGRTVLLGSRAGDFYLIEGGLEEGERVVVRGNFKIDSALQIRAQTSMMMPEEGEVEETKELEKYEVDETFTQSLKPLLDGYLALQKSLAADDLDASKAQVKKLPDLLEQADASALEEAAGEAWKESAKALGKSLAHAHHMTDLKAIRKLNVALSETWIQVVETFGITAGRTLYVAHCPMATEDKGASWLQDKQEVLNPFLGTRMLHCGKIKKTLEAEAEHKQEEE